jgi:protein gp37
VVANPGSRRSSGAQQLAIARPAKGLRDNGRSYSLSQAASFEARVVMAQKSAIEWTDATWNPVTGCTKISAGCDNCYAARFSERFRGVPGHPFESGFDLTLRPERLLQPLQWNRSRMIFVNSMSDLFHKAIPRVYISAVFDTMERGDWHTYQVLTKRSSFLQKFIDERYQGRESPQHIWFGVSVENEQATSRIAHLQKANVSVRFLSVEPLIAPICKLNLDGIHWVIVGGESGPRARPMKLEWVTDIRNQCVASHVAFFFKQWGGRSPKAAGRLLQRVPTGVNRDSQGAPAVRV